MALLDGRKVKIKKEVYPYGDEITLRVISLIRMKLPFYLNSVSQQVPQIFRYLLWHTATRLIAKAPTERRLFYVNYANYNPLVPPHLRRFLLPPPWLFEPDFAPELL